MALSRPRELAKRNAARREDAVAASREHGLAIRRLVHSESYPYLKSEAAKVVGQSTSAPPVDGNSLIAWVSATLVQWAFNRLFTNLEFIAKNIPDAPVPGTTRRGK